MLKCGIDDFSGCQQADVQHGGEDGVMDEGMFRGNGVLVDSEIMKALQ